MTRKNSDSATLPTQHFRMAMRLLAQTPELAGQLLEGTGVTLADLDQPGFSLPKSALVPLLENATRTFAPGWFLNIPVLWSLEVQTGFGLAMRISRDMSEALDILDEFWSIRWPIAKVRLVRGKSEVKIVLSPALSFDSETWRDICVLCALNFQTTTRSIVQDQTAELIYEFDVPAPPFADRLAMLVDGSVSWGNAVPCIRIPAALLAIPSPFAERGVFVSTVESLRRMAASHLESDMLSPRVRHILASVSQGQVTAAIVASRLGISRRTMERRLASEGASFQQIADSVMKVRFEALLSKSRMTAEVMAAQLGYHDGSSLMRVCRRWYGKSLSELRAAKRDVASR